MSLRSCDAISPPPIFGYSSIKMSIDGTAKDGSQLLRSTSVTSSLVVVSRVASESLKDFLLDLRHLCRNCNYPNVEEQLRHVFVFGIRDANIQQKLLATIELDLAKAFDIACSMASKSRELRINPGVEISSASGTVNAVQSLGPACYRCGETDHQPTACSFLTRQ